jgi:hypothetical protein
MQRVRHAHVTACANGLSSAAVAALNTEIYPVVGVWLDLDQQIACGRTLGVRAVEILYRSKHEPEAFTSLLKPS